jgi:hypothetical protein
MVRMLLVLCFMLVPCRDVNVSEDEDEESSECSSSSVRRRGGSVVVVGCLLC